MITIGDLGHRHEAITMIAEGTTIADGLYTGIMVTTDLVIIVHRSILSRLRRPASASSSLSPLIFDRGIPNVDRPLLTAALLAAAVSNGVRQDKAKALK